MTELGTRVLDARELKGGDVIMVKVWLRDKEDREKIFPWRRFACVITTPRGRSRVPTLNLKAVLDMDRDVRDIQLDGSNGPGQGSDEVYLVPEDKWPQGVVAMRMKYIALGYVKLESGDG